MINFIAAQKVSEVGTPPDAKNSKINDIFKVSVFGIPNVPATP